MSEDSPAGRPRLADDALHALFRTARSSYALADAPVTDAELRELYGLLRMAPTSANWSPAGFVFLRSTSAKQRLLPALSAGRVARMPYERVRCRHGFSQVAP